MSDYKTETIKEVLAEFNIQVPPTVEDAFIDSLLSAVSMESEYNGEIEIGSGAIDLDKVNLGNRIAELEHMLRRAEDEFDIKITREGILKPIVGLGGRKAYEYRL